MAAMTNQFVCCNDVDRVATMIGFTKEEIMVYFEVIHRISCLNVIKFISLVG